MLKLEGAQIPGTPVSAFVVTWWILASLGQLREKILSGLLKY